MSRKFEKGFLAQWVLLAVGLVLLGGAVAHNLYKIHRDIMVGERHRLQTQARVVSDNLTVQIATADRVIKSLCSELGGRDPDTWQAVIEQKQMRLFQDVLPGIRVLNAIDAAGASGFPIAVICWAAAWPSAIISSTPVSTTTSRRCLFRPPFKPCWAPGE